MTVFAIIGGSGLYQFPGATALQQHAIHTPYGEASALVSELTLGGVRFFFLPRHGREHQVPPHKINYRANIAALQLLGVTDVIACNAVGGIGPGCGPGALLLPDDLLDYSYGREHTFSDGSTPVVSHIDFTEPYTAALRQRLAGSAAALQIPVQYGGTYACTQGPRLETPAEIRRLQRDGCAVVGMTGMPEAALARELQLNYASVCVVANWAAGLSSEPLTLEAMHGVLQGAMATLSRLLQHTLTEPAHTD